MQFNSVQSGSFLTGAKSVTDAATEIYNTAQQTGFQVDTVIKQANANEALKKVAAARRNALMATTATKEVAAAKTEDIKTKRDKAIKDIMRPAVRMEGVNRMAGSVAAGAYIMDEAKKSQKEMANLKDYRTKMQEKQEAILQQGKESSAQEAALYNQILKGMGVKFNNDGTPMINSPITTPEQTNNSGTSQNISSSSTSKPVEIQGSGVLSPEQVKSLAKNSGFTDSESDIVVKIAKGESSFNPKAHNDDASMGDNSYGLMQINMLGNMGPERRKLFGIQSNEQLKDPQTNMDAAFKIFQSQGFPAWTVYRDLKAKGEL